jgi:hypothetical protein
MKLFSIPMFLKNLSQDTRFPSRYSEIPSRIWPVRLDQVLSIFIRSSKGVPDMYENSNNCASTGRPGFVWCESAFVWNSVDGETPSAFRPCRPPSLSFSERKTRSGLRSVLFTFHPTINHRKFVVLSFAKQVFYLPTVFFFYLFFFLGLVR